MLARLLKAGLAIFLVLCSGCIQEKEKGYYNITPQEAKKLMDEDKNLLVVDVRLCPCKFSEAHLPNARWITNPKLLYNTTYDLLIYSDNGNRSETFCKKLVGHTKGKIYNLEGGIKAWEEAGYGIEH